MQIPEFTCLCPRTGQPDFATLELEYVPDRLCVELKSLKLYIWSFRDRGAFHEAVTNEIADHLDAAVQPRFLRLTRALQRARRHLHHRCRRATTARLAARRGRHPALSPHRPGACTGPPALPAPRQQRCRGGQVLPRFREHLYSPRCAGIIARSLRGPSGFEESIDAGKETCAEVREGQEGGKPARGRERQSPASRKRPAPGVVATQPARASRRCPRSPPRTCRSRRPTAAPEARSEANRAQRHGGAGAHARRRARTHPGGRRRRMTASRSSRAACWPARATYSRTSPSAASST